MVNSQQIPEQDSTELVTCVKKTYYRTVCTSTYSATGLQVKILPATQDPNGSQQTIATVAWKSFKRRARAVIAKLM